MYFITRHGRNKNTHLTYNNQTINVSESRNLYASVGVKCWHTCYIPVLNSRKNVHFVNIMYYA
jgi:hypothetical protein